MRNTRNTRASDCGNCLLLLKVFFLIAASLTLFTGCSTGRKISMPSAPELFTVYPAEKIRPEELRIGNYGSSPGSARVVTLAGNEYEPVVVGMVNPGGVELTVRTVEIEMRGNPDVEYDCYRIEYYGVETQTSPFLSVKAEGRWPDPLVPLTPEAAESGEIGRTQTFSFKDGWPVPAGENRTLLIDFHLSGGRSKSPGTVNVTFRFDNGPPLSAEFAVNPFPFDLPEIPALKTAFGFSWTAARETHRRLSDEPFDESSLHLAYLRLLGKSGISVYTPQRKPVQVEKLSDGTLAAEWEPFDSVTGKLLEGSLFPDVPPVTSFRFPVPFEGIEEEDEPAFYRLLADHLKENGWIGRAFYYLPDEPLRRQYPRVREISERIHSVVPELRRLVTEPFTKRLAGYVDIWTPDTVSLGDSILFFPFFFKGSRFYFDWQVNSCPSVYAERQALGEEFWFYNCMSAQYLKYPNMFIDYPAAYQRALPWLAFRYGIEGLLYWETTYAMRAKKNPWLDQYESFANGDGNLLYPGVPGLYGLNAHMPIGSLRLILLREGMEDFSLFTLLPTAGKEKESRELVEGVVQKSVRFSKKVSDYQRVRLQAAELLSAGHSGLE